LSIVVLVAFAEELESTVSAVVDTSERHIYAVAQPRIQTVHGIHERNDRRVSSSGQGEFKCAFLSDKSDGVVKIGKTWRLEYNGHRN